MNTRHLVATAVIAAFALACSSAHAQIPATTGTIFGTGLGSSPGGRDSNWKVVAVPSGFTPPSGQTTPYDLYVPVTVPGNFYATGNPQPGVAMLGGTNYWISPQATTASLIGGTYNWITQQQFYVPVAGFYRFDFQGAGDNELEFYIGGTIDTSNPKRPTINGQNQELITTELNPDHPLVQKAVPGYPEGYLMAGGEKKRGRNLFAVIHGKSGVHHPHASKGNEDGWISISYLVCPLWVKGVLHRGRFPLRVAVGTLHLHQHVRIRPLARLRVWFGSVVDGSVR